MPWRCVRLARSKSGDARRSLGWVPFKASAIQYPRGQVHLAGVPLSLWDSYHLGGALCAGARFDEVYEACSTGTCSVRGTRSGQKGVPGRRIREWTCGECGSSHHRDVNAAHNILSLRTRDTRRSKPASLA